MIQLLNADAGRIPLADESVHMCVTSPPYWGLRKYAGDMAQVWGGEADCQHEWDVTYRKGMTGGTGEASVIQGRPDRIAPMFDKVETATCRHCAAWYGELGLEPTPEQFVENMVAVFREVKRVLRSDGTLWLNLGDSYNSAAWGKSDTDFQDPKRGNKAPRYSGGIQGTHRTIKTATLKPKDLCGIPWRVAFALQADGWYLRDAIIWAKGEVDEHNNNEGSVMPGSQRDRCTNAYEMLFMLTKNKRYFFDLEAEKTTSGAVMRNVWRINTQSYPGAHFATFALKLPERCIKFGTSERGVCPECGAPWERVVEKGDLVPDNPNDTKGNYGRYNNNTIKEQGQSIWGITKARHHYERIPKGWQPTCSCCDVCQGTLIDTERMTAIEPKDCVYCQPVPAIVLDPFAGSGTTLLVARQLGRSAVGLDLSFPYLAEQAKTRLSLTALAEWEQGVARVAIVQEGGHKNMKINRPHNEPHTIHKKRQQGKDAATDLADLPLFSDA